MRATLYHNSCVADIVDKRSARAHTGDCRGLGGRRKIQDGSSIGKLQHRVDKVGFLRFAVLAVDLTRQWAVSVVSCSDYGLVIARGSGVRKSVFGAQRLVTC